VGGQKRGDGNLKKGLEPNNFVIFCGGLDNFWGGRGEKQREFRFFRENFFYNGGRKFFFFPRGRKGLKKKPFLFSGGGGEILF